jgi:hypothetical protein
MKKLKFSLKYFPDFGTPNTIQNVQLRQKLYKIRVGKCPKNTKKKFDWFFIGK